MVNKFRNIKLKYTIVGMFSGIVISIIIMFISVRNEHSSSFISSIIEVNKEAPINMLLYVLPVLILAVVGYYFAIPYHKIIKKNYIETNELKLRFESIYKFIEIIRKGEYDIVKDDFSDNDKIGLSLKNLRDEIEKNKSDDEVRQKEEIQRHWTVEGLALFGAVLREYSESIEDLAQKVISEMVSYLNIQQAGFYIIEDEGNDRNIIEIANFAYGRQRMADKKILWGEGLIGACIIEKKSTVIKKVSKTYTEIESGLGFDVPRNILISPILTEEGVVHGAIELASFKIFEDFEIKFVEQVSESIATTISTLKINKETERLLEESNIQSIAKAKQEEELRKTISEMERLQESADIQSVEFRAYQDATNRSLIRAEFSIEGNLLFANKKFIDIFEYKSNSEIQDVHISKFIHQEKEHWFDSIKHDIINNKHFEGLLIHTSKTGKDIWIKSSYIGLKDDKGKTEKILFLGIDSTDLKINENIIKNKLDVLNATLLRFDISPELNIISANNNLLKFLNFKEAELINKNISKLIYEEDVNSFLGILENINVSEQIFEGEFSMKSANDEKKWLHASIVPQTDSSGILQAYIVSAFDYSQDYFALQKIVELEEKLEKQTKEINTVKERLTKRVEQTREEMKDIYADIETDNMFFEKLLNTSKDYIISVNEDNKIVFINSKIVKLLSADVSDIKEKEITSIFPKTEIEYKGVYLGDVFNYENESLPINLKQKVFILDKDKKQIFFNMFMTESVVGLRKRLTVFLSKV